MSQTYYIERPPRLQPELPDGEVEIPAPPEQEQRPAQALLQLIALPAVSVVGALLAAVFGSGRSLLFLVPLGLSVAVTVVLALHARQKAAQHAREAHEAYLQRLLELRREMAAAHDIQRRAAQYSDPAPQLAFLAAQEAFQAAAAGRPVGRGGARLWERRPGDADFAAVRLGTGSGPSRVLYRLKSDTAAPGALQREARRLAADSAFIQGLPVTLALREPPQEDSAGPAGAPAARFALVLIGTQPERVYAFVQALLVQYTAWHAPGDARLYVLGQDAGRAAWRWAARLPHCAAQPGGGPPQALVFEDAADRQGPKEHSRVRAFLRGLRAQLDERLLRAGDPDPAADYRLPQLLLVVDLLQPPLDGSQLRDLEMDPGLSLLIEQGGRLGAAVIFLAPHAGQAPSGCQAVIELVGGAGAPGGETGAAAGFRYAETGADAKRQAGQADLLEDGQALAQFAAHLAPLRTRRSYGADLPRSLGMLEMLGVETAEQLEARLAEAWESSTRPDQAAWAGAPLGVLSGGDIRRLVFSADADGVHGLIAGSTGSGKSELLATLILSLAAAFDPTIVNFVLVDFKGGAAFEPFRNLPHVVDLVTNLHGNAVERMFAAIMAEIHRREALNVASGSKHIVHYRKNGLHLPPYGREVALRGETLRSAPYPHLFVFIDEFAEMIADSPEYKAQLNSITRLGRALGVHLVLAAQRPSGVTDQMRANIKFRIALRVETREESGEVLRRPDAAYLPTGIPGRGYLQVGNENIELIQVAWSGADYTGSRPQQRPAVIWRDRPGRKPAAPAGAAGEEPPKVFEMMVERMARLASERSLPQRKPWPDFLPGSFSLQDGVDTAYLSSAGRQLLARQAGLAPNAPVPGQLPLNPAVARWLAGSRGWRELDWRSAALRAVVGLVDNPYRAAQFPLAIDLRRGHAAIFGASGWGKTTLLRTLLAGLAVTHSPLDLHVYILDFGGRQMSVFRELPHVGALITPDEEERVVRLLRRLDELLEQRKVLLSDAGADDLYSYNTAHPAGRLPAVLVLIDNFAEFREAYDGLLPLLTSIARESRACGIHFVITADAVSLLPGKLYGLFTERLALKLSDASDYLAIVGRGARMVDDIPGRGYVQVGRTALEFQAALPVGGEAQPPADAADVVDAADTAAVSAAGDETHRLAQLVRLLREAASAIDPARAAQPVSTLPSRVQLAALLAQDGQANGKLHPVLGVDDRSLLPWRFDLPGDGPHLLLISPPGGGKTTLLRSLALSLAHSCPPERLALALVDFQGRFFSYGGQRSLLDLPHVLVSLDQPGGLDEFVALLQEQAGQLRGRPRALVVLIDNYDMFVEEARSSRSAMPALGGLARQHGTDGLHFVLAGSPDAARSADELRKQVMMNRMGLALASGDLVAALNGRLPRGLADAEQPPGRAFVVRSGKTYLVQLATPYTGAAPGEEQIEAGLDGWVDRICARYPGRPAQRRLPGQAVGPGDGRSAASPAVPADEPGAAPPPGGTPPPKVDTEALKPRLLAAGLEPALLALLSPPDILNLATELGLIENG